MARPNPHMFQPHQTHKGNQPTDFYFFFISRNLSYHKKEIIYFLLNLLEAKEPKIRIQNLLTMFKKGSSTTSY